MKLIAKKCLNKWYGIQVISETFPQWIYSKNGTRRLFLDKNSAMKCINRIKAGDKHNELIIN